MHQHQSVLPRKQSSMMNRYTAITHDRRRSVPQLALFQRITMMTTFNRLLISKRLMKAIQYQMLYMLSVLIARKGHLWHRLSPSHKKQQPLAHHQPSDSLPLNWRKALRISMHR
ncbi:hypothetical protein JB92DRAFT_3142941 [Gautieria morchelliformis]|nr:hypothetical protein JB92DRAFT_3142941 [Gautieria morchelliformis]